MSFGSDCGDPNYPGVYTNVAFYNTWINAQLTWNGGAHANIPTPRPSDASTILISFYTVLFSAYVVSILR